MTREHYLTGWVICLIFIAFAFVYFAPIRTPFCEQEIQSFGEAVCNHEYGFGSEFTGFEDRGDSRNYGCLSKADKGGA